MTALLKIVLNIVLTILVLPNLAQAQAAPQQPAWMTMVPMVFMFAVLYWLMIRPQMKKQKQHQEFITQLKRGDQVVTSGGIFGTIEGINDQFVTLEVADGVRIKMLRAQVATSINNATPANEVKK